MTDELEFFSNDCNNWNYNPFINTPDADPYNLKRTIERERDFKIDIMTACAGGESLRVRVCVCVCVCVCV
jgi:hypothetical protein